MLKRPSFFSFLLQPSGLRHLVVTQKVEAAGFYRKFISIYAITHNPNINLREKIKF
jgi:hypothetical protein